MENAIKQEVSSSGIARLIFDMPNAKVNTFSLAVLDELSQHLKELEKNSNVKILVLESGKKDCFIAGADLHSFAPAFKDRFSLESLLRKGHEAFNRLQNLPFPSVAVINGSCFGGGLECALACTYRIVTDHPKTILALPEVTLGIIPGWGGTQRLPRLVGLVEGLGMVLSGRRVNAMKAWKMHLADAIVPFEFKEQGVKNFLDECLTASGGEKILKRREGPSFQSLLLEKNPIGRQYVFAKAKKDVLKKTKGHYPAPLIALDLIEKSYGSSLELGLEMEIQALLGVKEKDFASASNLIQLFFTQEALKKDKGVVGAAALRPIEMACVLGAGTMGSGIAFQISNYDVKVRMKDIAWDVVGKGLGSIYALYQKNIKDKRLKPYEVALKFQHVIPTTSYQGFYPADIVIEAAVENLDLKIKIFKELEAEITPEAIIGTNTSSLTLSQMEGALQHKERFIGMHFFNPVNRMPLVEVVRGGYTSDSTVATVVDFCKKIGKVPIVVKDCPGFLVNRVFVSGANEIIRMFEEGIEMKRLEKAMLGFGMPMSPFLLADEVGNDVGYKVSQVFEEAYGERMRCPDILKAMFENKLYGKKSGEGFYVYQGKKEPEESLKAKKLQDSFSHKNKHLTDLDIVDRVILSMINEASRCLAEGVVANAAYLDMAMVLGTGFPPFRGGPLKYAETRGLTAIVQKLELFESVYGARFKVAPHLAEMAEKNKTFY